MKNIESYKFGRIKINGKTYENDVIIFPNKVKDNWWRKEGHNLHMKDVQIVIEEQPDILIIGKGANGRMRVRNVVKEKLKQEGINKILVENTKVACQKFNEHIRSGKKVVAALHLTC